MVPIKSAEEEGLRQGWQCGPDLGPDLHGGVLARKNQNRLPNTAAPGLTMGAHNEGGTRF